MITGANTNVRHRGIIFHVQTEDSGRANPRIISHLYHHGTILASQKTDYSEHLEAEDLEPVVRGLIEAQHKTMLKALTGGEYDDLIDERIGTATEAESEEVAADDGPKTDGLETPTPLPEMDAPPQRPPAPAPAASSARAFGEGIVSQKPLDEVILEYLAEKARDRAADRADKSAQKSRSSG
ncbi:MAG: hypothetical protein ACQGVC_14470 [Myxococcota bacterium]